MTFRSISEHLVKLVAREVFYRHLNRMVGPRETLDIGETATLIIPSYHSKRTRNLAPMVTAALKCDFLTKVIVSNHNPTLKLPEDLGDGDDRVVLINHTERRGCGYCWVEASEEPAGYFIIVDDDCLLRQGQLGQLFRALVDHPEVPHGVRGWDPLSGNVARREAEVRCLYNIYAVTSIHLQAYLERVERLTTTGEVAREVIDYWADDILISQSGQGRARVHDVGRILRCATSGSDEVALWRQPGFESKRLQVYRALGMEGPS